MKNLNKEKEIIVKKFNKKNIKNNYFDLIIIPNLIHHLKNSDDILIKSFQLLRKGGKVYIFEPILREIHQKPDDYIRYTPYGMRTKLSSVGYKNVKFKTTGGPFSSTIYCLDQAIQYLPRKLRTNYSNKIFPKFYKKFMNFEKKYKINKVRKHTIFPTAFSIIGKKMKNKILAVILARSKSKGLKNKNIKKINIPLIGLAAKCSIKSKFITKTLISTDNIKYGNIAKKFGADFFTYEIKKFQVQKLRMSMS